jgi:hypothetical protein
MSVPPENAMPSWRDLSEQLSSDQIKQIEEFERYVRDNQPCLSDRELPRLLLSVARDKVAANLTAAMFVDVPNPFGATKVKAWEGHNDQRITRTFTGTERGGAVYVRITGVQAYTGDVLHRGILVDVNNRHGIVEIDASAARQIATDLLAAADELESLTRQPESIRETKRAKIRPRRPR